jgi:hypothetical protein
MTPKEIITQALVIGHHFKMLDYQIRGLIIAITAKEYKSEAQGILKSFGIIVDKFDSYDIEYANEILDLIGADPNNYNKVKRIYIKKRQDKDIANIIDISLADGSHYRLDNNQIRKLIVTRVIEKYKDKAGILLRPHKIIFNEGEDLTDERVKEILEDDKKLIDELLSLTKPDQVDD